MPFYQENNTNSSIGEVPKKNTRQRPATRNVGTLPSSAQEEASSAAVLSSGRATLLKEAEEVTYDSPVVDNFRKLLLRITSSSTVGQHQPLHYSQHDTWASSSFSTTNDIHEDGAWSPEALRWYY
jgi:hypothetical protein